MDLEGRNFVRRGNTLVPADIHADEWMKEIPEGREVILRRDKARSPKHHRWFFALLKACVSNWPDDSIGSIEELLDALKLATGLTATRASLDGRRYLVLRSIAWASMDQYRFKDFVDRCVYVLSVKLGVEPEALIDEIDATQQGFYRSKLGRYGE